MTNKITIKVPEWLSLYEIFTITSVDIKRSFSIYKNILTPSRMVKNLKFKFFFIVKLNKCFFKNLFISQNSSSNNYVCEFY